MTEKKIVDTYLLKVIGKGGMGLVWSANLVGQRSVTKTVVIKMLHGLPPLSEQDEPPEGPQSW